MEVDIMALDVDLGRVTCAADKMLMIFSSEANTKPPGFDPNWICISLWEEPCGEHHYWAESPHVACTCAWVSKDKKAMGENTTELIKAEIGKRLERW